MPSRDEHAGRKPDFREIIVNSICGAEVASKSGYSLDDSQAIGMVAGLRADKTRSSTYQKIANATGTDNEYSRGTRRVAQQLQSDATYQRRMEQAYEQLKPQIDVSVARAKKEVR